MATKRGTGEKNNHHSVKRCGHNDRDATAERVPARCTGPGAPREEAIA